MAKALSGTGRDVDVGVATRIRPFFHRESGATLIVPQSVESCRKRGVAAIPARYTVSASHSARCLNRGTRILAASTSDASLQLFYSEGSPYARICRMAVRERGLTGSVREVITTLRDPAAVVLPHTPVGRVPTLVLPDGTAITETTLVLGWLDRLGDEPALLPRDAAGIAAYGRVLGLLDGMAVWNRELRRPESERSPSVLALETGRAGRVADFLEGEVARGGYANIDAGALTLASILGYAERRHTVWKWRAGRPQLERWFERFAARPSFSATLPPPSGI